LKLFSNHKWWWAVLVAASIIVSIITSYQVTLAGLIGSVAGHLLFSIVVAYIPWLFYWLLDRPLTSEEMMSTISVAWLILAVANLLVM